MAVQQISVFIQSQPGHIKRILDSFVEYGIRVRGSSCSDTGDYGIVRFVVDNPDKAMEVLKDQGAAATLTEILCLKINDTPGELARVFGVISKLNMNIKYSYSLISTYIALSVDDVARAEDALKHQPVELVTQDTLK